METKICNKCGVEKSLSHFYIRNSIKGIYRNDCKECSYLTYKKYRLTNNDKLKQRKKNYYEKNKDYIINKSLEYREKNIEKIREYDRLRSKIKRELKPKKVIIKKILTFEEIEQKKEKAKEYARLYYQKNKETHLLKKQEYRRNNPEKYKEETKKYYEKTKIVQNVKKKKWINENREKYNEYFKNMKKNNHLYNVKCKVRNRIHAFFSIHGIKKLNKTFEIVGCTPQFLKEHIEKQFVNGMTWENYGQFGWHIDHIIPLSLAKNEDDIYKLCHYTNLQPLWWRDNLSKGTKILTKITQNDNTSC